MNRIVAVGALLGAGCFACAFASTPVVTRSYDNARTGANTSETVLKPQDVAARGMVRVKSLPVDDDLRVEAQPLYLPAFTLQDGTTHDVVFIASMGNHVYAYDLNAPETHDLLWKTDLGKAFEPHVTQQNPRQTEIDLYGINNLWGVLSTPVIDRDAGRMYVVNWVVGNDGRRKLMLHRVDLRTGTETSQPAGGRAVSAVLKKNNGATAKDLTGHDVVLHPDQKQRAALLLAPLRGPHKTLFVAVSGGENPGAPHGWVVAFDVDTFQQTAAWVSTPSTFGGGIWQGAQGPAADDVGNVYFMTGNGGYLTDPHDANHITHDKNGLTDFAEAFVKLAYTRNIGGTSTLKIADWFIPFRDAQRHNVNGYDYRDQDLGSAAPVLPPGTHLLLGAGKDGLLYVMDRDHLGKKIKQTTNLKTAPLYVTYNGVGVPTDPDQIDFTLGAAAGNPNKTHHLHGSPVYWNGAAGSRLFTWGENESLRAWNVDGATGHVDFIARGAEVASANLAGQPNGFGGMPGGMLCLSANGATPNTGILWSTAPIDGDANQHVVDGIVRAYDASQLDPTPIDPLTPRLKLLWDSQRSGVAFHYSKFNPPVVADGHLLVPTYDGRVDIYTLKP